MECDDNWANLSTYWDKYGTGTWMPLGYDMNQSWGHIYYTQTIGYAIKTSAGWLDLADQSGVAFFPVAKPIERLVFAGCGDLGGVSGDYLVLPGFTFSIQ